MPTGVIPAFRAFSSAEGVCTEDPDRVPNASDLREQMVVKNVQKKAKIMLTAIWPLAIVALHTVNT